MTPAKAIARLRRLAEDWRYEEAQLCKQFGDVIAPQSMRARRIKDTQAIDAAVEMIERMKWALTQIAETDPIDAALDPQRAIRIARAALEESK